MGIREDIASRVAALLGVSAYSAPPSGGLAPSLDDPSVIRMRRMLGGQIQPLTSTTTRWFLSDLETAQREADGGDLSIVGKLAKWTRTYCAGDLGARCGKAVRLHRNFTGDPEMVRALTGRDGARSVFDEMFPSTELERVAEDVLLCGVWVAELVPVQGRDYPVMVRLEPEHLRYRPQEARWYFNSIAGQLPITPGDGRWMLGTLGRMSPWNVGLWHMLGRAAIQQATAEMQLALWEHKWANPVPIAKSPLAADGNQRAGFFRKLFNWSFNAAMDLPAGWDVDLLESNGRGYESAEKTIARSKATYQRAIRGEEVTSDGGSGFGNAEVPERVLTGLVADTHDQLAYTINTQGIPQWVVYRTVNGEQLTRFGVQALSVMPVWEPTTRAPKDLQAQGQALVTSAQGVKAWIEVLAPEGKQVDVAELATEYGVPIKGDVDGDGTPDVEGNDSPANDVQAPDDAAALAQKMTEKNIERCEHGSVNRCRLCGIERVRDFEVDESGTPRWKVAWRPIVRTVAQAAAVRRGAPTQEKRYVAGIPIVIDRPRGYVDGGVAPDGSRWERVYQVDYGYIPRTEGGDGEPLDVFLGPSESRMVYWATQVHADGSFDELKLFIGFDSLAAARACYLMHIPSQYLKGFTTGALAQIQAMCGAEVAA